MSEQQQVPLSEWIIIKALYTNPLHLVDIAEQLDINDFTYRPFRILYNSIRRLVATDTVVNADSIMALLQTNAPGNYTEMASIGGKEAIETLYDAQYKSIVNLDEHVKVIRDTADNMRITQAADTLKCGIQNGKLSDDALEEFDKTIQSIKLRGKKNQIEPIGTSLPNLLGQIINRDESVLGVSISRKFPNLDAAIKRIQPKRVTVFLSNFKSGKSTVLLELGWYIASECGQPVLFMDTELFEEEVQTRLLAKVTRFPMEYITSGYWNNSDEHRNIVLNAAKLIQETPFMWVNVNHMSRSQILSLVKLSQLKHGIKVCILDYIKPEVDHVEARVDLQIGAKVDMLKEDLAKACDIAVLSAVQMNGNTGKVANSQEVERLADNVIVLRQTTEEDNNILATHVLHLKTSRYTQANVNVPIEIDFAKQNIREV